MMEISPAQVCSCTNTCSTNKHAAAGCHKVCLLQSEQSWRLKKKSMNGKSPHCLGSEWIFFFFWIGRQWMWAKSGTQKVRNRICIWYLYLKTLEHTTDWHINYNLWLLKYTFITFSIRASHLWHCMVNM